MSIDGRRRSARGFTLIELMIAVAVVAILASIAYPSYMDSVRKSRRGQAKADLVELAQILERYHTNNLVYPTGTSWTNPLPQSPRDGTAQYAIDVNVDKDGGTYTLTATPSTTTPAPTSTRRRSASAS